MKIKDHFEQGSLEGDIGFEMEVEGDRLPKIGGDDPYFVRVTDGSLIGRDTGEFIFRKPLPMEVVPNALDHLSRLFQLNKTKMDDSVRAGIHVHLNAREMDIVQVYSLVALYLIFEEILVSREISGEGRDGNLFCLRSKDADYLLWHLTQCAKSKRWGDLYTDEIRYSSLNLKCLVDKGSVEFRSLRTTNNFAKILYWINTLNKLKISSLGYKTPQTVIEDFSLSDSKRFLEKVFGEYSTPLYRVPDYSNKMLNGMRNAQDIAFCIDWSAYAKKLEEAGRNKNPFKKLKEDPVEDIVLPQQMVGNLALDNPIQNGRIDDNGRVGRLMEDLDIRMAPRPPGIADEVWRRRLRNLREQENHRVRNEIRANVVPPPMPRDIEPANVHQEAVRRIVINRNANDPGRVMNWVDINDDGF